MGRIFASAILVLVAACTPEEALPPPPPVDLDPGVPILAVSPTEVLFDAVEVGVDPPATAILEVKNLGEGPLLVSDVRFEGEDCAPFHLVGLDPDDLFLPPGQGTELVLGFDPYCSGHPRADLVLHSSDPTWPVARVPVHGPGLAPLASAEPVDFGHPYIGCVCDESVSVVNAGNLDLEVLVVELLASSGEVELAEVPRLPATLGPEESLRVEVRYEALDELPDTGWLVVSTTDPWKPELWVELSGSGTFYGEGADKRVQRSEQAVDVLFTLDRSGSMSDDNALVVANFATFLHSLEAVEVDYHIGVAVEDDGCFLGDLGYVRPDFSTSDAQRAFQEMADIYLVLGTYGANTERGFSLAEAALKSANIGSGGCNEGFYRAEASLALIHISDEPEQSVNPYTYYVSLFQGMKSHRDLVTINAVAGDYPSGCGSASAGTGYYEATVATGGLFLSICATDWGSHLESLARVAAGEQDVFRLTQVPVEGTIAVSVDGVRVVGGWSYDPEEVAVVFERDHVPEAGAEVLVTYHLLPDCDCG